jgi:DNA-binding HxlR family transcriptional regulator
MLTLQLRELEALGVIHRTIYPQLPPRVEYSLTDVGRESEAMRRQFHVWRRWWAETIGMEYDDWLMMLSGRWMVWIWHVLFSGPKRFSELQRRLPQANRQILAARLRDLERIGVIRREVAPHDAKIYYRLTEMGWRSEPMLRATYAWRKWFCDQTGLEFDWPLPNAALDDARQLPDIAAFALDGMIAS